MLMAEQFNHNNTRIGTLGGTLVVLLFKVNMDEIMQTAFMAAVGATVSFGISVLLRHIFRQFRRK